MTQYKILAGINYPPNKRAEIGDIVTDLPGAAIKNLLEIKAIELVGNAPSNKPAPTPIVEDEEI